MSPDLLTPCAEFPAPFGVLLCTSQLPLGVPESRRASPKDRWPRTRTSGPGRIRLRHRQFGPTKKLTTLTDTAAESDSPDGSVAENVKIAVPC